MTNTRSQRGIFEHRRPPSLLCLLAFLLLLAPSLARSQTAPKLASVTPEDGATLVPTTASLVFVFDQEMDTNVPLFQSIPNVIAGNFEVTATGFNQSLIATWGADKKSFTLKAAIQFPYATFTWRLNPTGSIFPLKSKTGIPLATVSGTFSTGVGGTVPVLGSTSPANNTINVSPDAPISFHFDQVMKTNTAVAGNPPAIPAAIAWSGIGLDPSQFRYSWSANSRSLLCTYPGGLPPNTEITWALNPPSAPVKLENPAGKAVPSNTYAGSFTTGSGIPCNPTQPPPDQGYYTLFKNAAYLQNSSAIPVPSSEDAAFVFGAIVQGGSLGDKPTSGSLTLPNGTQTPLASLPGQFIQFQQRYPSEAELQAAAPPGSYSFRFVMGTKPEASATLEMPAANPPIPHITNFDAAQAIRPDSPFTLSWNSFPGAGASDFIALTILDERGQIRFSAPDPCIPRELPSSATSIVIPAKSFATNSILSGTLVFNRNYYYSTNAVPKMAGFGSIGASTQFTIRTTSNGGGGTPPAPARLTNPQLLPNGSLQFSISGTANARYTIERTPSLSAGSTWSALFTVTLDAAGRGVAEDPQPNRPAPAFYRAAAE